MLAKYEFPGGNTFFKLVTVAMMFTGYVTQEDKLPRKPAPDMLFKAMADIGVETCIYIGDSEVDVTTAHGANLPCLSVTWGFRDEDQIRAAGGTHFCHETKDLAPMLRQMLQQL